MSVQTSKPILIPAANAAVVPKTTTGTTKVLLVGVDHSNKNTKNVTASGNGTFQTGITSSGNGNILSSGEKPKRKRQRLDHLTQEEKIMRRKMKNRMAAQSARDRKKVKMQDLENQNQRLIQERSYLQKRNRYLEHKLRLMSEANDALRQKLGISPVLKQELDDGCEMSFDDLHEDSTEERPFDADLDDYDDDDDDDDDESSRSSDYYSSSSMANAFESAELINGSLPKDQASAKVQGRDVAGASRKEFVVPHHHHHNRHSARQMRQQSLNQPSPMDMLNRMTCSVQQLTSFLMLLLTTMSAPNISSEQSSAAINFVSEQLSQMQDDQIIPSTQSQMSELMSKPPLSSLFQRFQKKVRLRM